MVPAHSESGGESLFSPRRVYAGWRCARAAGLLKSATWMSTVPRPRGATPRPPHLPAARHSTANLLAQNRSAARSTRPPFSPGGSAKLPTEPQCDMDDAKQPHLTLRWRSRMRPPPACSTPAATARASATTRWAGRVTQLATPPPVRGKERARAAPSTRPPQAPAACWPPTTAGGAWVRAAGRRLQAADVDVDSPRPSTHYDHQPGLRGGRHGLRHRMRSSPLAGRLASDGRSDQDHPNVGGPRGAVVALTGRFMLSGRELHPRPDRACDRRHAAVCRSGGARRQRLLAVR